MSKRSTRLTTIAAGLVVLSGSQFDLDASTTVSMHRRASTAAGAPVELRLVTGKAKIDRKTGEDVAAIDIQDLSVVAQIYIGGQPVSGLVFEPVNLWLPFFLKNERLAVYLAAVEPQHGADVVKALYATNVPKLSDEGRYIFLQRARAAAQGRIPKVKWSRLHDFDVQSTFKYLEVVRELAEDNFVRAWTDAQWARDWLLQAIQMQPLVVQRSVGVDSARRLIEDIDSLEGRELAKLWTKIQGIHDVGRRLDAYEQYWQLVHAIPLGTRRMNAVRYAGINDAEVALAMSDCIVSIYRKGVRSPQLKQHIRQSRERLTYERDRAPARIRTRIDQALRTTGQLRV